MFSWIQNKFRPTQTRVRAGVCALVLLATMGQGWTADAPTDEAKELATANRARLDRNYDYAEKLYQEFITKHPDSAALPEAVLGQAEACYRQRKYDEALKLLREHLAKAGNLSDQYEYWIGENLFSKGEIEQAETAFAGVISRYPASTNVLKSALAQADTYYQRKNYEKTVSLLSDPGGAFANAQVRTSRAEAAIKGILLLGESLFELKRYAEIEPALAKLPTDLKTGPAWQKAALLARTMMATDRAAEAEAGMTNLLAQAEATGDAEIIAETHAINGAILEQLKRPAAALAAYQPNLKPEVAEKWRRQAIAKTAELSQAVNGPAAALSDLELLSAQGLDAPARDLVQLTMGELRLGLFYGLPPAERADPSRYSTNASNFIFTALSNFTNVITGFTNSPYLPKAWLDRGWCDWELRRWTAASESFGEAAGRLADGVDKAKALFKLGDSFYQQKQFANALTNYSKLVREFGDLPPVKEGLLDQAYYQMIQAAIQTTNQGEAEFAVKALLAQFPGKFYAERGLLLVGQFLNDIDQPEKSRAVLENFSNRFPNSTLAPEIELAIARTYELNNKWPEAASIYDKWIHHYTNHASLPSAEFSHAFALYQAGELTNSVAALTNFVARFPDNELAPKAFVKLGNYYDSIKEFQLAELNYQQVFTGPHHTNWPISRLTYEAQIFASRAALGYQGYSTALSYITNMLNVGSCASNDVDFVSANCCPRDIYAEGLYAYGDIYSADPSVDAGRFEYARNAYKHIVDDFTDSDLVPAAYGRIGECSVQLGRLTEATNAFTKCMTDPRATVSERSQAEIELGQALEKEAEKQPPAARDEWLIAARDHYLNVFYKRKVHPEKGEVADNRWIQRACESAARLAISQQDFAAAVGLYEHLREMLPVLADYYDAQIRDLKKRSESSGL